MSRAYRPNSAGKSFADLSLDPLRRALKPKDRET
jgi:hypothetical protein